MSRMRLFTTCCISFLALVVRSNSSAVNATRPGSAEAAAAAEGRLVFINNSSYVSRLSNHGTREALKTNSPWASCIGIEEDVPLPQARPVYIRGGASRGVVVPSAFNLLPPGTRHPFLSCPLSFYDGPYVSVPQGNLRLLRRLRAYKRRTHTEFVPIKDGAQRNDDGHNEDVCVYDICRRHEHLLRP